MALILDGSQQLSLKTPPYVIPTGLTVVFCVQPESESSSFYVLGDYRDSSNTAGKSLCLYGTLFGQGNRPFYQNVPGGSNGLGSENYTSSFPQVPQLISYSWTPVGGKSYHTTRASAVFDTNVFQSINGRVWSTDWGSNFINNQDKLYLFDKYAGSGTALRGKVFWVALVNEFWDNTRSKDIHEALLRQDTHIFDDYQHSLIELWDFNEGSNALTGLIAGTQLEIEKGTLSYQQSNVPISRNIFTGFGQPHALATPAWLSTLDIPDEPITDIIDCTTVDLSLTTKSCTLVEAGLDIISCNPVDLSLTTKSCTIVEAGLDTIDCNPVDLSLTTKSCTLVEAGLDIISCNTADLSLTTKSCTLVEAGLDIINCKSVDLSLTTKKTSLTEAGLDIISCNVANLSLTTKSCTLVEAGLDIINCKSVDLSLTTKSCTVVEAGLDIISCNPVDLSLTTKSCYIVEAGLDIINCKSVDLSLTTKSCTLVEAGLDIISCNPVDLSLTTKKTSVTEAGTDIIACNKIDLSLQTKQVVFAETIGCKVVQLPLNTKSCHVVDKFILDCKIIDFNLTTKPATVISEGLDVIDCKVIDLSLHTKPANVFQEGFEVISCKSFDLSLNTESCSIYDINSYRPADLSLTTYRAVLGGITQIIWTGQIEAKDHSVVIEGVV